MEVLHESAILVAETKTGKAKYWQGRVLKDGHDYYTQTVWWQENSAVQESTPAQVFGKNIGRRNETHPEAQALAELTSEIQKLRDKKGYRYPHESVSGQEIVLPMLAEKFLESADRMQPPYYLQPKLDGHRALYDGAKFTTRGGKLHCPHVQAALAFDTKGLVTDGEIMLDPTAPACKGLDKVERFQLTAKAVKKDYPELTPWLRYYVYDVVSDEPFFKRFLSYLERLEKAPSYVILVHCVLSAHEEMVHTALEHFLKDGYEGVMVRDNSGGYEVGHRSTQLQKLKPYDDDEFEIVNVVPAGKGKAATVGKFVCLTGGGVEFSANPKGDVATRQGYLHAREQLIGKRVTVYFEGYSKDGKPRFPRAIAIREEGE